MNNVLLIDLNLFFFIFFFLNNEVDKAIVFIKFKYFFMKFMVNKYTKKF